VTAATGLKPPPKFVHNRWAWEHTLAKLAEKDKLDEHGNPQNYAAAAAIYKASVKKYGEMDDVPNALDFELAPRAVSLRLESDAWTVSRGCAWLMDSDHAAQVWLDPRFREAKHPLNPLGLKVVEPVVLWDVRIMRTNDGENEVALIEPSTVLWATEPAPKAHAWVRGELESAIGAIDEQLLGLSDELLDIGGVDFDSRFFDVDGTRAVMEAAKAKLEEVLA
jgi:hypothetical protein